MSASTSPRLTFPATGISEHGDGDEQRYLVEVWDEGIVLRRGGLPAVRVPIGSPVRNLGGGWLRVEVDGDTYDLGIQGWLTHRTLLATDLCAFLSRQPNAHLRANYGVAPGLLWLACLPLLIALVATMMGVPATGDGSLHALLWGIVGLGLVAWGVFLVWDPMRSSMQQVLGCVALNAVAITLLVSALFLESRLPCPSVMESAWRPIFLDDPQTSCELPMESGRFKYSPYYFYVDGRIPGFEMIHGMEGWRGQLRFGVFATYSQTRGHEDREAPLPRERFAEMKRTLALAFRGATVNERPAFTQMGWLGQDWWIESPDNRRIVRMFVDREEAYLFLVAGPRLQPDSPIVHRFFESITLPPTIESEKLPKWIRLLPLPKDDRVDQLGFTTQGKELLAVSRMSAVKRWDIATSKRLALPLSLEAVVKNGFEASTISLDGKVMAGMPSPSAVRFYDLFEDKEPITLEVGAPHQHRVSRLSLSRDGKKLCLERPIHLVEIWDVASKTKLASRTFAGKGCLGFSPDGNTVAIGGTLSVVQLWHWADNRSEMLTRPGNDTSFIEQLVFGPNDQLAVHSQARVQLVHLKSTKTWRTLAAGAPPFHMAFTDDGTLLATGSANGVVCLWDTKTGNQLAYFRGLPARALPCGINSIAFDPDGRSLAVACHGGLFLMDVVELKRTGERREKAE
jgi:hypothetical protein